MGPKATKNGCSKQSLKNEPVLKCLARRTSNSYDLNMQILEQLLTVEPESRDQNWEKDFFKAFALSKVQLQTPQPQQGPDGWPYLLVSTIAGDEPVTAIVKWLSTRGIGLVVNSDKIAPDFVFSYGMVWNFCERGEFLTDAPERKGGLFEIKAGSELLTGAPTEAYLPKYVRSVLKQFLLDQAVMAPKVLMVSLDRENYDLCFSFESLGPPPEAEHEGLAEALSRFLPAHYAVSILSEKVVQGFQPL